MIVLFCFVWKDGWMDCLDGLDGGGDFEWMFS